MNPNKTKLISLIINIVMVFFILMLLLKTCELSDENKNLIGQISNYKLGEKEFKKKINDDSSTIATQTQTIMSQQDAISLGLLKLDGEIKKVQSQVLQKQDVVINNVDVPYIPNGFVDTSGWYSRLNSGDISKDVIDSLRDNCILVNTSFEKKDKWFSINGKVKKDGIGIDTLKVENESSVTIGYKKSGFLGLKKEPIVEIKNTNPYLNVTKMNNIVIKKDKGILQNKFFLIGVGVVGGILLNSKL